MRGTVALGVVLVGGMVAVAVPLIAQPGAASGPVARYDMRAGTVSGMGAMGAGGAMGMMFGGGRGNPAGRWFRRWGPGTSSSRPAG